MAFLRTWNTAYEQSPADTDEAKQGALRMREIKTDVRERAEIDHEWQDDAQGGFHKKVTLIEQAADPANSSNLGILYTKDIAGITELFYMDDAGTILQITQNGALPASNAVAVSANDTAPGFLISKLASRGYSWVEVDDGAAETIRLEIRLPDILANVGDGSLGDLILPGSQNLSPGIYNYDNITVAAGQTLGISGPGLLVLRATGVVTIAGTISVNSVGGTGGSGGAAFGGNGANGQVQDTLGHEAGSASGGNGGDGAGSDGDGGAGGAGGYRFLAAGASASAAIIELILERLPLCGGSGGGGGGGPIGITGSGGAGGAGGGIIIIVADEIDLQAGGIIRANGGNGGNGTAPGGGEAGGGGGGGGGICIVSARNYIADAGTRQANGGAGGSRGGGGGGSNGMAGGTGVVLKITQ